MRLSNKIAGLCSSAVFLLTMLGAVGPYLSLIAGPPFVQMGLPVGMRLLELLMMAVGGALVAGALGFIIGDILAKPKGQPAEAHGGKSGSTEAATPDAAKETAPGEPGADSSTLPVLEAVRAEED